MPISKWSDRLAYGFAFLRAAIAVLFSLSLMFLPEKMLPGSSTEPARTLALAFASRALLVGIAFGALALTRQRKALAWLFFADAALQVFDAGMAFAGPGASSMAVLPAAFGLIDVWAGRHLLQPPSELR